MLYSGDVYFSIVIYIQHVSKCEHERKKKKKELRREIQFLSLSMSLELHVYVYCCSLIRLLCTICVLCAVCVCFFLQFISRLIRFSLICLSCFHVNPSSFRIHAFIYNAADVVSLAPLFVVLISFHRYGTSFCHFCNSNRVCVCTVHTQYINISCEPN